MTTAPPDHLPRIAPKHADLCRNRDAGLICTRKKHHEGECAALGRPEDLGDGQLGLYAWNDNHARFVGLANLALLELRQHPTQRRPS
jgi:hypothetical protein